MSDSNGHSEDPAQGAGGDSEYPLIGETKEARLERRVLDAKLRQRIPISAEELRAVIARQIKDAIDPHSTKREANSAARAVFSAVAINQADEHKDKPDRLLIGNLDDSTLESYAERLGLAGRRSRIGEALSNGNGNGHA